MRTHIRFLNKVEAKPLNSSPVRRGFSPHFNSRFSIQFSIFYFVLFFALLPRSFASLGFGTAFNQQTTIDADFETSQFPVDTRYVGEMT